MADDRPALAARAAMAIGRCLAAESLAPQFRTIWDKATPATRARLQRKTLDDIEAQVRECQALDEHSRRQWIPMMRRAVEDGVIGVAADIVGFGTVPSIQEQQISVLLPTLQRDALQCNHTTLTVLYGARRLAGISVPAEEHVAYRQVLNTIDAALAAADPSRPSFDRPAPPGDTADPARVQQLVAEIQSHCKSPGGALARLTPTPAPSMGGAGRP